MENQEKKQSYSVQVIVEGGKWPFVGTAFQNKDGSMNVLLKEGV